MKNSVRAAALMLTTALTPVPASAAVLGPFFSGVLAGVGVGAGTVGSALASILGGSYAAGFAASSFLTTTFVGQTVLSLGLSAASQYLTRRRSAPPSSKMANFAQPISYAEWAFGRLRKGGPLGFTGFASGDDVVTGESGRKRHYSPVLAMHRCQGIVEHWLGDVQVEIDGDGTVTTAPLADYYRIRPFTGQPGQSADPELVARFSEMTSAHDFVGLTGAHIWAKAAGEDDFNEVYPTGRQADYAPVFDGHDQIYDPRDTTFKWTRNAALIAAFVATNIWGVQVNWDEVAAEADVCDVQVPIPGGGTQARWRIDGAISDEQDFEDQRAQLQAAADIWFYERSDGKLGLKVGRWIEPQVTLTPTDFLTLEWTEGASGKAAPSEVAVKYIEPANGWIESPTAAYEVTTGGRLKRDEPEAYLISSHNQAWRMAVRLGRLAKPDFTLRGTLGIVGYYLQGERFLRLDHPVLGNVTVEVQSLTRSANGLTFDLEAVAVAESDFAPDVSATEPARPEYKKVVSDDAIPDLADLSGLAEEGGIRATWTDPDDESLTQQLRTRQTGTTDWQQVSVPAGQTEFLIPGLVEGLTYDLQGRNQTPSRRSGDWSPGTPIVVDNTPEPVAIEDLEDPGLLGRRQRVSGWRGGPDVIARGTGVWWLNEASGEVVTAARLVHEYGLGQYQKDQAARSQGAALSLTRADAAWLVNGDGVLELAAADEVRLDFVDGTRALLVEPARTNLLLHSGDPSNAAWTKARVTATADASAGPDGASGCVLVAEDTTASNTHLLRQTRTVTGGAPHALMAVVSRAGRSKFQLRAFQSGGINVAALFDLAAITATPVSGSPAAEIYALDNDWYLCALQATPGYSGSLFWDLFLANAAGSITYTGDGSSGLLFWHGQLEAGTGWTSPIVTGAATASRAADVPGVSGITATLDVTVDYADGTAGEFAAASVSPGYWPATAAGQHRLRRLVGRTP